MSTKYRQVSSRSRPACSGIGSWSVGNSSRSFTRKPSSPRGPFKSFDHLLALLQGDIGARTARESLAQGCRMRVLSRIEQGIGVRDDLTHAPVVHSVEEEADRQRPLHLWAVRSEERRVGRPGLT